MRQFDKEVVVKRVQRALNTEGHHPAPRVYRQPNGQIQYRVGPGKQFVNVSIGKIWATITGGEKTQRVMLCLL